MRMRSAPVIASRDHRLQKETDPQRCSHKVSPKGPKIMSQSSTIWLFLVAGLLTILQLRQLEALSTPEIDDDDVQSIPFQDSSQLSRLTYLKTQNANDPTAESPPSNLLETYDYANTPVIPTSVYEPKSSRPVPVVLIGTQETTDDYNGWILDGIERSRYLVLAKSITFNDFSREIVVHAREAKSSESPNVFIVDWGKLNHDCYMLEKLMRESNTGKPTRSSYLLYLDTSATARVKTCPKMEDLFQKSRIRISKRAIVRDRHWNATRHWVEKGELIENRGSEVSGGPILHSPYILREAFVKELRKSLGEMPSIKNTVYRRWRSTELAHFWRKGDHSHYGLLRQEVSGTVNYRPSRVLVRIIGDEDSIEMTRVQPEYVQAMLRSKVVVVAQKDEWEDHHRLFESMASGALVFTDTIMAMPHGLRNRTNIVVYDGHESLKRQMRYYLDPSRQKERLEIARRGWKFVMGKQRSWHRLECLLFGMARTLANKPEDPAPER